MITRGVATARCPARTTCCRRARGWIYKPLDNLSLYASYSIAYVPRAGEQLASLSASNRALDPEEFTNREVGIKWDVTEQLAATAAIYELERTNVATADPAGSDPQHPWSTVSACAGSSWSLPAS